MGDRNAETQIVRGWALLSARPITCQRKSAQSRSILVQVVAMSLSTQVKHYADEISNLKQQFQQGKPETEEAKLVTPNNYKTFKEGLRTWSLGSFR